MMKNRTKIRNLILALITTVGFASCSCNTGKTAATKTATTDSPIKIILDTDFGDDGDDLVSLLMLHHMQDNGECEIIAVGQANSNKESPCAIDVINTYYNRPDIPIGKISSPLHGIADQYSTFLIENYPDLYDLHIDSVPSAVNVYRKALVESEDKSVVFVVIGFKKNMYDLLKSQPDEISPLTGIELVAKKVKFVSDMGGKYPKPSDPDHVPFNFGKLNGVAEYYVANWPTPMVFAGIDTGKIQVGQELRKLNTPSGRAMEYKLSRDGGWGKVIEESQAAFDCVSTLIAVRGADDYFNLKYGHNKLDSLGMNIFTLNEDGAHSYVDCKDQKMDFKDVAKVMEEMAIAKPKQKK